MSSNEIDVSDDHDQVDEKGIKKPKSSYIFFYFLNNQSIKEELLKEGKDCGLGQLSAAVGVKWKSLTDMQKEKYERLAAEDRDRYNREMAVRDEEFIRQQEERRKGNDFTVETDTRMRKVTLLSTEAMVEKESKPKRDVVYSAEVLQERAERKAAKKAEDDAIKNEQDINKEVRAQQAEARLKYLLGQSDIFSHFGAVKNGNTTIPRTSSDAADGGKKKGAKSKRRGDDDFDEEDRKEIGESDDDDDEYDDGPVFLTKQPSCISGGDMRQYQLEGLNWMIKLSENGINGILADEMGLGKTLQSISVLGYLKEFRNVSGPHLVMVPKSTLSNWINEFKRWCPSIRAVRFHGSKDEREEQVRDIIKPGKIHEEREWDVVVTTYEVLNLEKTSLSKIAWKYLIIDEAHRLKNEASQFSQTVRMLDTQHRLLLTGTPLQNNLHELWALLNFLLPDVFASSEQFDEWFNLSVEDIEAKQRMIGQLHKILRPFMLRRLKADVEKSLPPKSETILFTGLTVVQKNLYKQILMREIDTINGTTGSRTAILNIVMQLRKCCNHPYLFPNVEDRTQDSMGDHLYLSCGKMILLHKLLKKLNERGHRVLIFSQMTKMLDILEDYFRSMAYNYCRIDGNTTYDEREDRIADYNSPNSNKFIFLLSTRAGGLGINLQTADTVILYDSDWNPQADLQAQDRAHRIGQKKSVQVFRLVTDETVEVKVVERAQQKLKLDAMVVQQGRLQDKDKKMSKESLLESIRFGADKIFRTKDSNVTDADIDLILEEGRKRTEELNEKLQVAEKGDLYDFSLDGGMSSQVFQGIDYSARAAREQHEKNELASMAALQFIDPGKRERKVINSYAEQISRQLANDDDKKVKLPRSVKLPRMEDWMFYNRDRLTQLHEEEIRIFDELVEKGDIANMSSRSSLLPSDLQEEKLRLLSEGFGDWTKVHYNAFTKAAAKHGRNEYEKLAKDIGKPLEDVKRYGDIFWNSGQQLLPSAEWDRQVKNIEKGEKRLEEISRLTDATAKLIMMFDDPWEELTFRNVGTQGRIFNAAEDRFLLCLTHVHGYGSWDLVRSSIRRCERFRFDFYLQSCTAEALGKRCENLMRSAERELLEIERKKNAADAMAIGNAQSSSKKNSAVDVNSTRLAEITKQISDEAKRLANTRAQLQKLRGTAPAKGGTKKSSSPQGASDSMHASKKSKVSATSSSAGTGSIGSLLRPVPDALIEELVNLLLTYNSDGVSKIVSKFCDDHSEVSKRQAELKVSEIAYKEKKESDQKARWYINYDFLQYASEAYRVAHEGPEKLRKASLDATAAAAAAATTATAAADNHSFPGTDKVSKKDSSSTATTTPAKRKVVDGNDKASNAEASSSKKAKSGSNSSSNSNSNSNSSSTDDVKKPKNAFHFFVKSKREEAERLLMNEPGSNDAASKNDRLKEKLKSMWASTDDAARAEFTLLEDKDNERYKKELKRLSVSGGGVGSN